MRGELGRSVCQPAKFSVGSSESKLKLIREATGRLVTVLELLSPTNKLESDDRDCYLRKRRGFRQGGANVVELDLVRQGAPVFPAPFGASSMKPELEFISLPRG